MSFQMFRKNIVPTTALTQTKSFPVYMTSIDGISIQPIYTDATPAAVVVASASISGNVWTSTAHGLTTGLVVQLTTSSALPTPLMTSTNYYVIRLTANTFSLASSLIHANAGTPITLSDAGTGNQTVTPTSLSFTFKIQAGNDGINWVDIPGTTVTISSAGNSLINIDPVDYDQINIVATATSGVLSLTVLANAIRRTSFQ